MDQQQAKKPTIMRFLFKLLVLSIIPGIIMYTLFSIINAILHIKIDSMIPQTLGSIISVILIYRYLDKILFIKKLFNFKFSIKQFFLFFLVLICLFLIDNQLITPYIMTLKTGFSLKLLLSMLNNNNIILVIIYAAIIAPILEEMIFRGAILKELMNRYSANTAIIISALAFSIYHLNMSQFPFALITGLFLGWVFVKTKSLTLTILLHALNNFLLIVLPSSWVKNPLLFPVNYHPMNFMVAASFIVITYLVVLVLNKSFTGPVLVD